MLEMLLAIALTLGAGLATARSVNSGRTPKQSTANSQSSANAPDPVFESGGDPPIIITGG